MLPAKVKKFVKRHDSLYRISKSIYGKTIVRSRCLKKYPTDLNFELTTRCNSRCAYCAREMVIKKGIRNVGDIDFGLIKQVINEFSRIPEKNLKVSPVGLGEPLLHPKFFDTMSLIRNRLPDAFVHADTNAIALDEKSAEKLINSGLDLLIVSVNAHDKETYKKINIVDKFDEVVSNVKTLLNLKGNRPPSVVVQLLDIDVNRPHFEEFRNFWEPLLNDNDELYFRPFNDFGGSISLDDFVSDYYKGERYPCPSMFSTLTIDKDGFVFPCCMGFVHGPKSDICLGNINEKSVGEIYSKEGRIHRLRGLHKTNRQDKINACKECWTWASMPNPFIKLGGKWV